ncbi:amidase, partial [Burkholderia pseudomallei]
GGQRSRDPVVTRGRVPGEIVVAHAVSRSVRESALLRDITTGGTAPGTVDAVGAPGSFLGGLEAPPAALSSGDATGPRR